jgi:hypothetical protein
MSKNSADDGDQIAYMSAHRQLQLFKRRKLSPVEVLRENLSSAIAAALPSRSMG